jgi:hypothetical protein
MRTEQDFVVFSDLHGRVRLLEAVYRRYGDSVAYISCGDAVDAPEHGNVKETIALLQAMGAVCLYGNHEWVLGAAMHSDDEESRRAWSYTWSGYQRGVLKSYGLPEPSPVGRYTSYDYMNAAKDLKQAIADAGHTAFFDALMPYYEAQDTIVIHGGITHGPLQDQKRYLDRVGRATTSASRTQQQWNSEPKQIFDPYYELAQSLYVPQGVGKKLITGHAHSSEHSISRITDNGNRIRLAGSVAMGMPLYVYESWSGGVMPIHDTHD